MRTLTKTWQEALSLANECNIIKAELTGGSILGLTLKDPTGQTFKLQVIGTAGFGLNGNLVTLNTGFNINALVED